MPSASACTILLQIPNNSDSLCRMVHGAAKSKSMVPQNQKSKSKDQIKEQKSKQSEERFSFTTPPLSILISSLFSLMFLY